MNDYNKKDAEPVIRVVNWFEEKALLDLTGHTRRNGIQGRDDNHQRTIYHTECDFDYESEMAATHSDKVYNSAINERVRATCARLVLLYLTYSVEGVRV